MQDIFKELREFSRWNELGVELNVSDNTLKVIDIDQRNVAGKTQEVVRKWHKMNEKVCWEALTAALKAIDEANLAKKIADKHCRT